MYNEEYNEMYNGGVQDPNYATQPPMPPAQPRMPQSVEQPQIPVNEATMEQQIAQAKKFLDIDVIEKRLNQVQEDNVYKDNLAEVLGKYPELNKQTLESKLRELEAKNPEAFSFYRKNRDGLDMFAKNLKETIVPKNAPDEITDDGATSSSGADDDDELEKRVKAGNASMVEFGEFINKLSK